MSQKLSWIAVIVVSMVLGGAVVIGMNALTDDDDTSATSAPVTSASNSTNNGDNNNDINLEQLSGVAGLYEQVHNSVVRVAGSNTRTSATGLGSGIVLDKDGHILTNHHVVEGFTTIEVSLADGTTGSAEVVGTDPGNDLAVIKTDIPADKLVPARLGDSSKVVPGEPVIAIGNPFNIEGSVTQGIVSGIGRTLQSGTGRPLRQLIQADAAINPGNSGGALFNAAGEVIGVTTAIENPSGDRVFVGIGYAVPIDIAKRFMPDMLAGRDVEHPRLGVQLRAVSPATADDRGLEVENGVQVMAIDPGSAAARAGMRAAAANGTGGDVIVSIDGTEVKTFDDLANYIDSKKVGDTIQVTVNRGGDEIDLDITLDAWESGDAS